MVVVAVAVAIALHIETYVGMVHTWFNTTAYNHCVLIPFIAAYLVLSQKANFLSTPLGYSRTGVTFVALNVLALVAGSLLAINALAHIAAVGVLIGVIWSLIGNRAAKLLWFPLLYLYFMVPEGVFLVPYLQDWTASVVVALLRATEIPVFLEGRYLQIPSGRFHVAKACSGINYLLATLAVGSMFAYLTYRSTVRRAIFMLFAVAVPLVANGVRAYGIVMIAHLSDYKHAMGVDHFIYGWVFFGFVIFVLFSLGQLFSDGGPESGSTLAPQADTNAPRSAPGPRSTLALLLLLLCLPLFISYNLDRAAPSAHAFSLPELNGWRGPANVRDQLKGHYPGAVDVLNGRYTDGADTDVDLVAAVYLHQEPGAEVVNTLNSVYDDDEWKVVSKLQLYRPEGSALGQVRSAVIRNRSEERQVWWWYQIGQYATTNPIVAKLKEAQQRLTGRFTGGAMVSVSTPLGDNKEHDAESKLTAFRSQLQSAGIVASP